MVAWFARRYLDVLGSIYIYNEHRGYTAIDRVLEAVRMKYPDDRTLIAAIAQHRADERKHYVMFRRWFELRGVMPFALDRAFGHIDRFIELVFRKSIDELDTQAVVDSDELFEKLCRVISLTERRGHRTVQALLRNPIVLKDSVLTRIFRIILEDEPSHWAPYEGWLGEHGRVRPARRERLVDRIVHSELLLFKLPLVFLNPRLDRRARWADAAEESTEGPPRPSQRRCLEAVG
ncbi:ferritin-like domain-containing protein [Qipengyuania sediminis]|uniref:ferritin-like domain-containing protein n=1 Tax=Qipengyuania sediminis TaxID=1532023 RepID=UPI00105A1618|nr:ferritin-like domain-containing protein [Qipengyuania sediminis]